MQTQQAIELTVLHPQAVAEFHKRRGTEELAQQAVSLVQETFPAIQSLTLQAVQDPEEDSEWLRLTVTARLSPAEMRAAYDAYLERWVAETPPDSRHLVVLQRRGG